MAAAEPEPEEHEPDKTRAYMHPGEPGAIIIAENEYWVDLRLWWLGGCLYAPGFLQG